VGCITARPWMCFTQDADHGFYCNDEVAEKLRKPKVDTSIHDAYSKGVLDELQKCAAVARAKAEVKALRGHPKCMACGREFV
jgi:hypothetical protein